MAIGDGVSAIASLTAGFGGFSPTAFDGVEASKRQIELAENTMARVKEQRRKKAEYERARTSKPRQFDDERGSVWTYVVVDNALVRILDVSTSAILLEIPETIEGLPVKGLAADACADLKGVQEIVCPKGLEFIGSCAFRFCDDLRKITLPRDAADFSRSWLQQCNNLEELVLPGMLEKITSAVFDNPTLRVLHIGSEVHAVENGAFEKTNLEEIVLDESNESLITDGVGLYTYDGTLFVALCKQVRHLDIREGCTAIAQKACCNFHSLESVSLPNTLERIDRFAFAHTGLRTVDIPKSVHAIEEKAFYYCQELTSANLNEGLQRLGNSVFEETALEALHIPASIREIGSSVVARTNVVKSGLHATISIDENSPSLFLDGSGGLYRREQDGVHLIQLIDESATEFQAHESTRVVNEKAFAIHTQLKEAHFHEGLEVVQASAFRVCKSLTKVVLPDTVRVIGANAFLDTNLESFRVPGALEELGADALVSEGSFHLGRPPSLKHVEVAEGNEHFYVERGMLIERTDKGSKIIVYSESHPDVVISEGVTTIASHAFSNARGVRSLSLPASLKTIETAGLGVWSLVESIHIELATPLEGRSEFDFHFPATDRSIHSISLALGGSSWVNVPDIMAQYDNCIANAHDYHGHDRDSISVYDQVTRVIERLRDPILLTATNRKNFDRLITLNLEEICVDIARHDDRAAIDALLDFGYLNEGNLESVIGAVGRLQDAAMTAYLLEVKRMRFNRRLFDFDL